MTLDSEQLALPLYGPVDLNGYVDSKGIRYIGEATWWGDHWRCLADVLGLLCIVEVRITGEAPKC